jgi:hypothetical protein
MRLSIVVALALIVGAAGSTSVSPALAASDCPKLVELADWGENSTGDISVASGQSCLFPITMRGTVTSSEISQKPAHGKLKKLNAATYEYKGEGQIQGKRFLCHQSNGSGADGFGHVGHYRARDNQIAFLAPIAWLPRRCRPTSYLFHRSSQASDPRARGNRPTVLGSGRRADIAVFVRSDDSNEDRAEQKHREQNQPGPGRR